MIVAHTLLQNLDTVITKTNSSSRNLFQTNQVCKYSCNSSLLLTKSSTTTSIAIRPSRYQSRKFATIPANSRPGSWKRKQILREINWRSSSSSQKQPSDRSSASLNKTSIFAALQRRKEKRNGVKNTFAAAAMNNNNERVEGQAGGGGCPASIEEILMAPIQLTERVREAVEEAESFKQDCADVARQAERLAQLLRSAARVSVSSSNLYTRPMLRVAAEVVKSLEKALALVKKCKRSGILKRVITITSGTDFRKIVAQLESSIGDVNWLLSITSGNPVLSLPPIASTDPMLAWVWTFVSQLQSGNPEEREEAANNLASLASDNDRNGKIIIEEGGVGPLLRLLKEGPSVSAQVAAALALGKLSSDKERVQQIVDEGAVTVLLGVLNEGSMRAQAKVSWALSRMVSHDDGAREAFGQNGAVRLLVSLLAEFESLLEDNTKTQSAKSIHSLVQSGFHRRTGSGDSTPDRYAYTGRSYISSREMHRREREEEAPAVKVELKTEVARAFWRLAEGSVSNSKRITDTKALLCVSRLIQKEGGELRKNCLMAIMEITAAAECNVDLRRATFKTNSPAAKAVVEQLLRIAEEEDDKPDLQKPAIRALGSLSRTFPAREIRVLKPLVKQLGNNKDMHVAAEAATALQKFAEPDNFLHTEHSKQIIEFGGVPYIMRLIKVDDKAVQVPALVLLCYLALHAGNSEELEKAKALGTLESASRTPISQSPSLKEVLPRAIKHLELYQSGCQPSIEMHDFP